jgi:protein TonB
MNKSVFAAVILSVASTAFAGEVPASLNDKNCKAEYPKASLMNEEQGDVTMAFLVAPTATWSSRKWKNRAASRTWTRPP